MFTPFVSSASVALPPKGAAFTRVRVGHEPIASSATYGARIFRFQIRTGRSSDDRRRFSDVNEPLFAPLKSEPRRRSSRNSFQHRFRDALAGGLGQVLSECEPDVFQDVAQPVSA